MIVYGKNVAIQFLENNKKIEKIILQEGFQDKFILSLVEKRKLTPRYLPKREIDRVASGVHQGIILYVEDFKYSSLEDIMNHRSDGTIVILDHLEDPHNLGAIIRTCEAAGVVGIIIPRDRGVSINATVMKTSAGALENMKIVMVTNLTQAIKTLKENGFWIVGTDMNGQDYTTIDYHGKIALIIGNEGAGMGRLVKNSCDYIASIPMVGQINSLNASVAAGIMIYEVVRQKGE